jgi:hypothetical protein
MPLVVRIHGRLLSLLAAYRDCRIRNGAPINDRPVGCCRLHRERQGGPCPRRHACPNATLCSGFKTLI